MFYRTITTASTPSYPHDYALNNRANSAIFSIEQVIGKTHISPGTRLVVNAAFNEVPQSR